MMNAAANEQDEGYYAPWDAYTRVGFELTVMGVSCRCLNYGANFFFVNNFLKYLPLMYSDRFNYLVHF